MKRIRVLLFYILVLSVFSGAVYIIISKGTLLESSESVAKINGTSSWTVFTNSVMENAMHPLALLLAQIITIIIVARILGFVCKKIGQPTVIGEIAAGIILGPSLVGSYFPEFSALMFPSHSYGNLQFLSQIGLILFMFMVGMELELKVLKNKAKDAFVISQTSIIFPFTLGLLLAYFIYTTFAPKGVGFLSFSLFIGIAMSITAFPVLARIVHERGMHKTALGAMVITCAAVDDVTAWCLLAAVIAIVKAGSLASSIYIILLAVFYVLMMIYLVRPFLRRVGELYPTRENLSKPIVAIFFLTLIVSSLISELIGIHALFGAFMAGAIMPENMKFRNIFIEKVEDVALVLLLPLFFVFTGLRTQIGLLNDPGLWQVAIMIILVAVTGKFLGSSLAARFVGQSWKNALSIGALMNTRGLMELVVLNIGYDLGILSPEIFAMMVIMALITTFMTGPSLDIINWLFRKTGDVQSEMVLGRAKILISFSNPKTSVALLRLAKLMTSNRKQESGVTVMHLAPNNELNQVNIDEYEEAVFESIDEEAKRINQPIMTMFKVSNDIRGDIASIANSGDYDLLLIGIGKSIYDGSILGRILGFTIKMIDPGRIIDTVTGGEKSLFEKSPFEEATKVIVEKTNIPVGVLMSGDLEDINSVILPFVRHSDDSLLNMVMKLLSNSSLKVWVVNHGSKVQGSRIKEHFSDLSGNIEVISYDDCTSCLTDPRSLLIINYDLWQKDLENNAYGYRDMQNVLVICR